MFLVLFKKRKASNLLNANGLYTASKCVLRKCSLNSATCLNPQFKHCFHYILFVSSTRNNEENFPN